MFGLQQHRTFITYILLLNIVLALDALRVFQYYRSTKYNVPNQKREIKKIPASTHNAIVSTANNDAHTTLVPWSTHNPVPMLHPNPFQHQTPVGALANRTTAAATLNVTEREARPEGAFCRRNFDGQSGYCILAYQCLHAIRDYRVHGTKIDVCTYRRNVPVICCPLAQKHVEKERISVRKCREYNKALQKVPFMTSQDFSGKQCVASVPMIVGGVVANDGEYPHMAALGWTQSADDNDIRWGCGGTLISDFFVLTAAHCATSVDKPPDVVRLGARQLNASATTLMQQDIDIQFIIMHPKYRSNSYYHDIALLKLAKRVKLTTHVRPACLWQLPNLPARQLVVATGWGRTKFRGTKSDVLQKVNLNMIEQEYCKGVYRRERRLPDGITDQQFCAGHLPGGKDTCQGDSGGPLHVELPEFKCGQFIVGITSFGKFCAKPNSPGVYTKVYAYLNWIESIAFRDQVVRHES